MTPSKPWLREEVRRRLAARGPSAWARADGVLRRRLSAVVPPEGDVLAYAALPDEVDLGPLLRAWSEAGRLLLPRVVGRVLDVVRVRDVATDLAAGTWGILEPRPSLRAVPAPRPRVVIVPGRAFDRHGGRVGRGGGYYDRLLPSLGAGVRVVGVARDVQIFDRVPMAAHDRPMDCLVTESGVSIPSLRSE